jgi:ribosomal protein S18 acetylase RimI-like enzyme
LTELISIRKLERADLPAICIVLERTGLFPPEMLAGMAESYLSRQMPHHWLIASLDGAVVGFAYAEPERMAEGTFNLLAIAVEPDLQGRGIGKKLVSRLEQQLREGSGRVLIVETSSLDHYAATRAFYADQSFAKEAQIRSFYAEGEDKIVSWKHL